LTFEARDRNSVSLQVSQARTGCVELVVRQGGPGSVGLLVDLDENHAAALALALQAAVAEIQARAVSR
jgi:hypothetical protein